MAGDAEPAAPRVFQRPHAVAERPEHGRVRLGILLGVVGAVLALLEEAAREERLDLVLRSLQRGPDLIAEALVRHRRASVPEHDRPGGHVLVEKKSEKRRVGFLLGEIPRAPQHRDGEHVVLVAPIRLIALGRHGVSRPCQAPAPYTGGRCDWGCPPLLRNCLTFSAERMLGALRSFLTLTG